MEDKDIEIIRTISESMERRANDTMRDVIEQYGVEIVINVMINVATSMLAKSLILTPPSARDAVQDLAFEAVASKVSEGTAAVESILAIQKAKVA